LEVFIVSRILILKSMDNFFKIRIFVKNFPQKKSPPVRESLVFIL
jgi:hypothetical protein